MESDKRSEVGATILARLMANGRTVLSVRGPAFAYCYRGDVKGVVEDKSVEEEQVVILCRED